MQWWDVLGNYYPETGSGVHFFDNTNSYPTPPSMFEKIKLSQYYCTKREIANMQGTGWLDSSKGKFSQWGYHFHSPKINNKQESQRRR